MGVHKCLETSLRAIRAGGSKEKCAQLALRPVPVHMHKLRLAIKRKGSGQTQAQM